MYKKGTVILVPFPFTDLSGNKVRPAVIISNGKIGKDVVVVFVTSQARVTGGHVVSVQPTEENGLKVPSKIICAKIATVEAKIVLGELGSLSETDMTAIDTELRQALGLL